MIVDEYVAFFILPLLSARDLDNKGNMKKAMY